MNNPVIIKPETYLISDSSVYPNNAQLPVLLYRNAVDMPDLGPETFERIFIGNGWSEEPWRNGIFTYHHYHSTAHEVLGIYSGEATVLLGGDNGITLKVQKGDVLVIPAGVSHKNIGSDKAFKCVGSYPRGQKYDINTGKPSERPRADRTISKLALPETDPLYGAEGPLLNFWKK